MRWALLGTRPPDPAGGRLEARRFLRDFLGRSLLISIPLGVLVIAILGTTLAAIVIGGVLLLSVLDFAYLAWAVSRERS